MADKKLTRAEIRAQISALEKAMEDQRGDDVAMVGAALDKLLADNELSLEDLGLQKISGTSASAKFGAKRVARAKADPTALKPYVYDRADGSLGGWGGKAPSKDMIADGLIGDDGKVDKSKLRAPTAADQKKWAKQHAAA